MKILCITDQFEGSDHSSIEGIFGKRLQELCEVSIVFFTRTASCRREGNKIYIPYRYKRNAPTKVLNGLIALDQTDTVIVRNLFPVLKDVLRNKRNFNYRVGFWHSFPHSYRRLFEAQKEGRAVVRKAIEYKLRTYFEKKLMGKCDFLITMSQEFKDQFYSDLDIKHLSLPMGVSFDAAPSYTFEVNKVRKFIYTGTVDHLRETELIVGAFAGMEEDFALDIFTRSDNAVTKRIRNCGDPKITIHPAVPRGELLKKMQQYDIGIGLIPENSLYRVSSPTKTLEYYSVGLPALINYLPEYISLFDKESAFFCNFTREDIQTAVRTILKTPKERLIEMGNKGRGIIKEKRDYKVLGEELYSFLRNESV